MSDTITATTPTVRPLLDPDPVHRARLPLSGILHSEWTKLRSVRSTWWTLITTLAITVGLGALLCVAWVSRYDHFSPGEIAQFDPTLHSLRAIFLAQLPIGVLGVLAITNEHATGMIRNTFAAVPQRRLVLAAKAAIFGLTALVVGEVGAFAAFFIGQAILAQKHAQATIGQPGVARAVIGAGLYLAGIGLLGLALGTILRRTAGAIASLFALVLVLPILASALPSPWSTDVNKLLPGEAGTALINVHHVSDALSPAAGAALFAAYLLVAFGIAFVVIDRRDA